MQNTQKPGELANPELSVKADRAQDYVAWKAYEGGLIGLGVMLAFHAVAMRKWPFYTRMTRPGQLFVISAGTMAGLAIRGDKALIDFQRRERLEEVERRLGSKVVQLNQNVEPEAASDSAFRSVLKGFRKYRWEILFGTWAGSLGGSLWYSFSTPGLKFSQKVMHARVYAQGATLGALLLFAGLNYAADQLAPEDPLPPIDPARQFDYLEVQKQK